MGNATSGSTRVILVAVGAAVLAGAAFLIYTALSTDDEPPIRVKKGSMHLDLVTSGEGWSQDDQDGKVWSPKGSGQNSAQKYTLKWSLEGTPCGGALPTEANRVQVWYSDQTELDFKHRNNKSELRGSSTLSRTNDERRLKYGATGYVARVRVTPGNFECSFRAGEFNDVCLCHGTCPTDCFTAPPN